MVRELADLGMARGELSCLRVKYSSCGLTITLFSLFASVEVLKTYAVAEIVFSLRNQGRE